MTENEKIQFVVDYYSHYTKEDFCKVLDVSHYWVRKTIKQLIKDERIESPKVFPSSRKSEEKYQFIIDNYSEFSRKELAERLNESPRWIKRAISNLIKSGKLKPKIESPEKILSKEDWVPDIRNRAFELRSKYLKTNVEICSILKKEFDFDINPPAFQFWMDRFNCKGWNKQKWLNKFLPKHKLKKLLNQDYKIQDIMDYIREKYGLYFSEDILVIYIKEQGLLNYKLKKIKEINDKAQSFSKGWLEDKINSHLGLRGLEKEMGVSKTIVMKRINEEGLQLIKHRKIWSQTMEALRDSLLEAPALDSVSSEDVNQMILGWLLGDGHLDAHGRFVINHSINQLDYLYVKVRVLKQYITNIVTVPRNIYDNIYGGKEQLGISCPGFKDYLKYLNADGTKNYEMIMSELNDLGWACYFMDDGSYVGQQVIIMNKKIIDKFINRFIFKDKKIDGQLCIDEINPKYIIPGMAYKTESNNVGSYWKRSLPELFDIDINSDLSLSFVNAYTLNNNKGLLNKVADYYYKRGFPYFSISDDYLIKEYKRLKALKSDYFWRNEESVKYITVGSYIFKHFMKHMVEAKYRQVSPLESFNNYSVFLKTLEYSLRNNKTLLPDYVYDSLIYFNGGVTGFPCAVAKAVVEKFCPEKGVVVDPCAGWGGRLLGCTSADRYYIGFEPWKKTYKGLQNIISFFNIENAEIKNSEFEFEGAPKKCDLIFTSPPYVDLEVYENAMTKEEWVGLLAEIYNYARIALVEGGYLILNLPQYLVGLLTDIISGTNDLVVKKSLYFFTSSRKRDISKAEILYIWYKPLKEEL